MLRRCCGVACPHPRPSGVRLCVCIVFPSKEFLGSLAASQSLRRCWSQNEARSISLDEVCVVFILFKAMEFGEQKEKGKNEPQARARLRALGSPSRSCWLVTAGRFVARGELGRPAPARSGGSGGDDRGSEINPLPPSSPLLWLAAFSYSWLRGRQGEPCFGSFCRRHLQTKQPARGRKARPGEIKPQRQYLPSAEVISFRSVDFFSIHTRAASQKESAAAAAENPFE